MPLSGLRVIEFAGLAPGPFTGLVLADNGATVIRVDKLSSSLPDVLCRGKRSIAINSKRPTGRDVLRKLISSADVVIDPFRPGVMERLGLGPEVFLGDGGLNQGLIYARIVGFPRKGPQRDMAGHDINYLALSGALAILPGSGKPAFPLNILADFAGGGLVCVLGILLALIERGKSGRGQVVDTDMVSGTRYISAFPLLHSLNPLSPLFGRDRGNNLLDGGAPFYDVYTCRDGGLMSVGCLEPPFFEEFINRFVGSLPHDFDVANGWKPSIESRQDQGEWPKLRQFLTEGFLTNTRDYWASVFQGSDACALPVLTPQEARASVPMNASFPKKHPSIRGSQSNNARTEDKSAIRLFPGEHTDEILDEIHVDAEARRQLAVDGALGEGPRVLIRPKL